MLSGDTLKLTSAQFQNLLDAEANPGEIFSGKIKLAAALAGDYDEVYAQITDYRIALEEGFNANEYSAVVSGTMTVAEATTLVDAGLLMSKVTYPLEDAIETIELEADDDTDNEIVKRASNIQFTDSNVLTDAGTNLADLNTIAARADGTITTTVDATGARLAADVLDELAATDLIQFRINTSATAANITTIITRKK